MPKDDKVHMPAGRPFGGATFSAKDTKEILLVNLLLEPDSQKDLPEEINKRNFEAFLEQPDTLKSEDLISMIQTLYNFTFLLKENNGLTRDKIAQSNNRDLYNKLLTHLEEHPNRLTKIEISHRIRYFIIALYHKSDLPFPEPDNDLFEAKAFESEIANLKINNLLDNNSADLEWLLINMNIESTEVSDIVHTIIQSRTRLYSSLDLFFFRLLLQDNPTKDQLKNLIFKFSSDKLSSCHLNLTVVEKFIKKGIPLLTILDVFKWMNNIPDINIKIDGKRQNIRACFCDILLETNSWLGNDNPQILQSAFRKEKDKYDFIENKEAIPLFYHFIKKLGYAGASLPLFGPYSNAKELLPFLFVAQRLGIKLTENDSTIFKSTSEFMEKIQKSLSNEDQEILNYFERPKSELFTVFSSDSRSDKFFSDNFFNGLHNFLETLKKYGFPEKLIFKKMGGIVKHINEKNNGVSKLILLTLEQCQNIIFDKPLEFAQLETILENELSKNGPTFSPIFESIDPGVKFNLTAYLMLTEIKNNFTNEADYQNAARKMKDIFLVGGKDTGFQQQIMQILSKLSRDPNQKLGEILTTLNPEFEVFSTVEAKKQSILLLILTTAYKKLHQNERIRIDFKQISSLDALKEKIIEAVKNTPIDCNTPADLDKHPIFKLIGFLPDNMSKEINDAIKIEEIKNEILVKEMKNEYKSDKCGGSSSRADEIFGKDNALKDINSVAETLKERATTRGDGLFGKPNNQTASAKVYKKYKTEIDKYISPKEIEKPLGATASPPH